MRSVISDFLMKKFGEYYQSDRSRISPPTRLEKREFGFLLFKNRIMVRHRSFNNIAKLRKSLIDETPSDVYYSAAYYSHPTFEMARKEWQGADLIFDIDADHLETDCNKTHTVWVCDKCGIAGAGKPSSRCSECGEKIYDTNWLCETCLESAKSEVVKLIDMLRNDFGFPYESISVCFSGNRGYHVHVEREEVMKLDQLARREIIDYITCTGFDMNIYGMTERSHLRRMDLGPDPTDPGWRGRLARSVYDLLARMTKEDLINKVRIPKGSAQKILVARKELEHQWEKGTPWYSIRGVGSKSWNKIIEFAIKREGVNIDTVVTSDIHRLIRLPETLHGKTGFRTAMINIEELSDFDPLSDALVFREDDLNIHVLYSPEFHLDGIEYGPFRDENVELPMAAAILLLCKGIATLEKQNNK